MNNAVETVRLEPPTATLVTGMYPSVLEFENNRAAITMMGVGAVMLHDFAGERVDTIGRRGQGPGEFERAGAVVTWNGNRLAVLDPVLRRATIVSSAGRVDTLIGFPSETVGRDAAPTMDGMLWYSLAEPTNGADSAPLVRFRVTERRTDTIAFLRVPPREFIPAGATAFNLTLAYAPQDLWGLLPNGTLWVARGESNRVDWIDSAGRMTQGAPRAYASIRTTDADLRRLDGLPTPMILDTIKRSMSPTKAPFQNVVASADGELWFWLNQPAGYGEELYDVVGPEGSVKARVAVPSARKLIAIGPSSVFFFGEDSTGELVVSRHPRPRLVR